MKPFFSQTQTKHLTVLDDMRRQRLEREALSIEAKKIEMEDEK